MNRTTIVVILVIYFIALGFILSAINTDVPVSYDSRTDSIGGGNFSVFGFQLYHSNGLSVGNLVYNISDLPIWFNAIFIVVPSIILLVFAILMFIPTIPSG